MRLTYVYIYKVWFYSHHIPFLMMEPSPHWLLREVLKAFQKQTERYKQGDAEHSHQCCLSLCHYTISFFFPCLYL